MSEEVVANGVTSCSNTNAIVFPTATQNWPSATYLGVFSTQGDLLFYGPLAAARAVGQGDALAFGEGTIQLRLK